MYVSMQHYFLLGTLICSHFIISTRSTSTEDSTTMNRILGLRMCFPHQLCMYSYGHSTVRSHSLGKWSHIFVCGSSPVTEVTGGQGEQAKFILL